MIFLTAEEIMNVHNKLTERTGGSAGLRDKNLLESSVYSVMAVFDGVEAYSTVEEKAARFMYSLTSNHAFVDGNKRIGVLTMLMTLRFNGVELDYTQAELIDFGLSVADGTMDYKAILTWINEHKK